MTRGEARRLVTVKFGVFDRTKENAKAAKLVTVKFGHTKAVVDFRRKLRIHRPDWFLTGFYVALLLMFLGLYFAQNLFEK